MGGGLREEGCVCRALRPGGIQRLCVSIVGPGTSPRAVPGGGPQPHVVSLVSPTLSRSSVAETEPLASPSPCRVGLWQQKLQGIPGRRGWRPGRWRLHPELGRKPGRQAGRPGPGQGSPVESVCQTPHGVCAPPCLPGGGRGFPVQEPRANSLGPWTPSRRDGVLLSPHADGLDFPRAGAPGGDGEGPWSAWRRLSDSASAGAGSAERGRRPGWEAEAEPAGVSTSPL